MKRKIDVAGDLERWLSVAVVVVVVAWRGRGQSALGGAVTSGVLVSGTTDTITNIDPAGNYDFGTSRSASTSSSISMDAQNGAKIVPVARNRVARLGEQQDVEMHAAARRQVPRRLGVRLGGRQVLVRPGQQSADRKQAAANTPSSCCRTSRASRRQRQVRRHVQPQERRLDLAVHPGHRCRQGSFRARYKGNSLQGKQPAADRDGAVSAHEVHAWPAGRLRAVRRLLGTAGEERGPDHSPLLQVVDDEARPPAR